jgi:hypothetical protein
MKLVEKPTINLEGVTEDLADITYSLSELKEDLDYYRNVILNLEEHIKPNQVNHDLLERVAVSIRTFNQIEDVVWNSYLKLLQNEENNYDR